MSGGVCWELDGVTFLGLNSPVDDPADESSESSNLISSSGHLKAPDPSGLEGCSIPVRGRYYRTYPWMYVLASVLALVWLAVTFIGYYERGGEGEDNYDESGVLDSYGVSLMLAEQGQHLSGVERWIVDIDDPEEVRKDAIKTLERARANSQLKETGLLTLACLYWATDDIENCRRIKGEIPSRDFILTDVLGKLLADEQLDDYEWANFKEEIQERPRDWTVCFLTEKAMETQSVYYQEAGELAELVHLRKQSFQVVQTRISIIVWGVFLLGLVSCVVLIFKREMVFSKAGYACTGGVKKPSAAWRVPPVSRLVLLWPLSLAVIVLVVSDFSADWIASAMWLLAPEWMLDHAFDSLSVLIDFYWRIFSMMAMVLVFLVQPRFVRMTFLRPVPKVFLWVLAACSATWLFDLALYQLPADWFPPDPTVGHRWEESGWSALFSGFLSAVILAPVCEEIVFRGFLYNTVKNRFGVHAGIWISALIFASVHFYGIQDLIGVGFFGVVMAYLYRYTNSLLPCILCHALFNLIVTSWSWILYKSPEALWVLG